MSIRAKLKCTSISDTSVNFQCSYDSADKKEDNSFSEATPSGNAYLNITNQSALKQIEEGKYYYFDISPVEQPNQEKQEDEQAK